MCQAWGKEENVQYGDCIIQAREGRSVPQGATVKEASKEEIIEPFNIRQSQFVMHQYM